MKDARRNEAVRQAGRLGFLGAVTGVRLLEFDCNAWCVGTGFAKGVWVVAPAHDIIEKRRSVPAAQRLL